MKCPKELQRTAINYTNNLYEHEIERITKERNSWRLGFFAYFLLNLIDTLIKALF